MTEVPDPVAGDMPADVAARERLLAEVANGPVIL